MSKAYDGYVDKKNVFFEQKKIEKLNPSLIANTLPKGLKINLPSPSDEARLTFSPDFFTGTKKYIP